MSAESPSHWPSLELARAAISAGGAEGVKVAVIDSGIDAGHPALGGIELEDDLAISCDGVNLRIEENRGIDVYGHGTAVAGILLRETPGIRIGSFRALDGSNHSRSFVIAECVTQAIARGYRVINCSFGCRGLARYVMDYKEWVDLAYLRGVQIVAACSNLDEGIREWPAYFPSVFSVKGIDCPTDVYRTRRGQMVSFFAQGERVEVPWRDGQTRIETGSSYAAPLITARIARLLAAFPEIEPALVKPLLLSLGEALPE